jgi:hypothetical protein
MVGYPLAAWVRGARRGRAERRDSAAACRGIRPSAPGSSLTIRSSSPRDIGSAAPGHAVRQICIAGGTGHCARIPSFQYQYRAPLGRVGRDWDGRAVYQRKSLCDKGLQDIRGGAGTAGRSCKSFGHGHVTEGTRWRRIEDPYKADSARGGCVGEGRPRQDASEQRVSREGHWRIATGRSATLG